MVRQGMLNECLSILFVFSKDVDYIIASGV